jgi:phytoene synthase
VESDPERITRDSGSSFYYAFRILPEEKRRGIYALYAFCRVVDDCVDEEGGGGEAALREWLAEVERAYAGGATTPLGRELSWTVQRFPIPKALFEEIVAGCRMDLSITRYATFDDLRVYCSRVASAVGLATIEIFGYKNPRTQEYARELGLALQLTNILRDVSVDAARGRLYVPLEDLDRFDVEDELFLAKAREGKAPPAMQEVLTFQAQRARLHHERAAELLPAVDRGSMLSARVMGAVYRELLEEIVRRHVPLGVARVSLPRWKKLWVVARTVLAG